VSTIIETAGLATVINEFDIRGLAIRDLIKTYVPGVSGVYYGFRPLGSNDLDYPCIHIEPLMQSPKMVTTGKFHIKWEFGLFFFVRDNDPEQVVTLATSLAESLVKLFSNNALGDLSTSFSNKFKAYSGYWINSEMLNVEVSRSFVNATPDNQNRYMRAGLLRLEVEDVLLK
jgi:hypothetical protein